MSLKGLNFPINLLNIFVQNLYFLMILPQLLNVFILQTTQMFDCLLLFRFSTLFLNLSISQYIFNRLNNKKTVYKILVHICSPIVETKLRTWAVKLFSPRDLIPIYCSDQAGQCLWSGLWFQAD